MPPPARTPDPAAITDEEEEALLFDPKEPGRAALVDHLPGELRIDYTRKVEPKDPDASLLVVILPALTGLANLAAALAWSLGG